MSRAPKKRYIQGVRIGDVVAGVAGPIARGIDRIFGTNLQNCPGCQKRQKWLNDWRSAPSRTAGGDGPQP